MKEKESRKMLLNTWTYKFYKHKELIKLSNGYRIALGRRYITVYNNTGGAFKTHYQAHVNKYHLLEMGERDLQKYIMSYIELKESENQK